MDDSGQNSWRRHLALAGEYRREKGRDAAEYAAMADMEFEQALDLVPPSLENHLVLLETAAILGRLERLRVLYIAHEADWPFAPVMLARVLAVEAAKMYAEEGPRVKSHPADLLNIGTFVQRAAYFVEKYSRRWLGPWGVLIVMVPVLGFVVYINRDLVYAMWLLWHSY